MGSCGVKRRVARFEIPMRKYMYDDRFLQQSIFCLNDTGKQFHVWQQWSIFAVLWVYLHLTRSSNRPTRCTAQPHVVNNVLWRGSELETISVKVLAHALSSNSANKKLDNTVKRCGIG